MAYEYERMYDSTVLIEHDGVIGKEGNPREFVLRDCPGERYIWWIPIGGIYSGKWLSFDDCKVVVRVPVCQPNEGGFLSLTDITELVEVTSSGVRVSDQVPEADAYCRAFLPAKYIPHRLMDSAGMYGRNIYMQGIVGGFNEIESWSVRGLRRDSPKRQDRKDHAVAICEMMLPAIIKKAKKDVADRFIQAVEEYNKRIWDGLLHSATKESSYAFAQTNELKVSEKLLAEAEESLRVANARLAHEKRRQARIDWESNRGRLPDDLLDEIMKTLDDKGRAFSSVGTYKIRKS